MFVLGRLAIAPLRESSHSHGYKRDRFISEWWIHSLRCAIVCSEHFLVVLILYLCYQRRVYLL